MNLYQFKIFLPVLFICTLIYFAYSDKALSDNLNNPINPVNTGNISFYRDASTSGVGNIKFHLDNVYVGSSNKTFLFKPSCFAYGTVATTRLAGSYKFYAKADSGDAWNGYVTIIGGECTSYPLRGKL
ncbi:MAG: hypothetical protein ABIY50_05855 [Ignavibacteria bacterium]